MRVLHLMAAGGLGGIETLMRNYAIHSTHENYFVFFYAGGDIADELERDGHLTLKLFDFHWTTVKKINYVLKICRKYSIQAVVSHHSSPVFKVILFLLRLYCSDIRRISYAHANAMDICEYQKKRGLYLRKNIHRLGFCVSDSIIAISNSVKESLVKYLNIEAKRVVVLYNGVEIVMSDVERKKDSSRPVELIYVGRLIREKGVQTILTAIAHPQVKPFVHLTIVGDGEYRDALEELSIRLSLEKTVRFLGLRKDVPDLLKSATIFIHVPEWEEGFGITVLEAMAVGCVCICSRKGALPELIKDGETGILIPPDSSDELSNAIIRFLQRDMPDSTYQHICNNAQAEACKYSMESFSKKLDQIIADGTAVE